jgi:hypothetical protein
MKKNILLLFVAVISLSISAQTTYYVKATGGNDSNDGKSWTAAYASLQQALTTAVSGDKIWVAKGTYIPTKIAGDVPGTDNRDKTFLIASGISVYGGFAGTETAGYNLSTRDFTTNQTIFSGSLDGTIANDAYHTVIIIGITAAATLDGVSVTAGNANGTTGSSIIVLGKTIPKVYAGGVYAVSSGANLNLTNNNIFGNLSSSWGGGVFAITSSATGSLNVIKNIFHNNTSVTLGGGMYTQSVVSTKTYIANNVFYSNTATTNGAAIYFNAAGSMYFVNNTVTKSTGAAVYCYTPAATGIINITNSIIFGNTNSTIVNNGSNLGTTAVSYCLITSGYASGTSISSGDPLFADVPTFNFRLTATSPAINAGTAYDASLYGSTDLDNKARISQTAIDMGAYEFGSTLPSGVNSPSSNKVVLSCTTDNLKIIGLAGNEIISLFDTNGRQLLTRKSTGSELSIPVGSFTKGIYFVHIASSETSRNIEVIKN